MFFFVFKKYTGAIERGDNASTSFASKIVVVNPFSSCHFKKWNISKVFGTALLTQLAQVRKCQSWYWFVVLIFLSRSWLRWYHCFETTIAFCLFFFFKQTINQSINQTKNQTKNQTSTTTIRAPKWRCRCCVASSASRTVSRLFDCALLLAWFRSMLVLLSQRVVVDVCLSVDLFSLARAPSLLHSALLRTS